MDVERLRASFRRAAEAGDQFALYFYSELVAPGRGHPELRHLFPVSMAEQRKHLLGALARIAASADRPAELAPYLAGLGASHRHYGALAEHYPAAGGALLATLEHFCGEAWTEELAADWAEAYALITQVMTDGAEQDEKTGRPAAWQGTVLDAVQYPAADVTVLRVATDPPMSWVPGQSVLFEAPAELPRVRRWYSPAAPPDGDGVMELHVRAMGRGGLSDVLSCLKPGAPLRAGPPRGTLAWDASSGRDVVMAAMSTGLAPLKAVIRQMSAAPSQPLVILLYGARRREGLYDLQDPQDPEGLAALAARCQRWLTVVPVIYAHDGPMDAVLARDGWANRDAYLAGPAAGVDACAQALVKAGTPPGRIRAEDFGWDEPDINGRER